MLRDRESLIRLIGKRRRFLPNRRSILSSHIQNTSEGSDDRNDLNVVTEYASLGLGDTVKNRNGVTRGEEDRNGESEASGFDPVKCPVCGNVVCGGDTVMNTHLDACLARGTKRKSTQPTLLQFNFLSRSPKVELNKSDESGCSAENLVGSTNHKLLEFGPPDDGTLNHCPSSNKLKTVHLDANGYVENPTTDVMKNKKVDTSLYHFKDEKLSFEKPITLNDVSGEILETSIVGRRFGDEVEITLATRISFLRDPTNVKDANAIKVISTDSDSEKMLGFIPRELAQYLSPLIEKFCLSLEGRVISVPKHSRDSVPIQILCETLISCSEKEHDDPWDFDFLWKNVVESARVVCPFNRTKYQQNFSLLIEEVVKSNHHLFTDDENILLESFNSLPDDCQRLFIRLYTRKGPWFRICNISYPEISDCHEAAKKLSEAGYICLFECSKVLNNDDMKEILSLLTKPELLEVSSMIKKKKCSQGVKKQDTILSILSSYTDGLCPFLPSIIKKNTGDCVQIAAIAESLIWRAERLFFLNGEQDLSTFLLVDLGITKYPSYNCIAADQTFLSRNDLLAYEEALEVAQIMDESLDENNAELVERCIEIAECRISYSPAESVATFLSCFSASWIYSKVVFLGVSFFEREQRYINAINLLKRLLSTFTSDGRRGYWTLRLSIDMEHVGRPNESLSVAEDGLLDPWVRAGSKVALQRRVLRLGKPPRRWKVPSFAESMKRKITEINVRGRPLNSETGMKSRFYGEDGEQCGVEELALQYYAGEGGGWQGVHTESGIWLTIFGLLMWDILFTDVPNVFRNKFQTSPLDLGTDSFYPARKEKLEAHLKMIHDGMGEEILIMIWQSQLGTSCRGVSWTRHSLSVLRAAVTCVGGPCLASICRLLAQDYRSWSSGMPDLLLWRFHDDYRGEAKLVEVKGPRDRLSEQQRAWLLFLMDCGFNAEVCKVSPPIST